MPTQRAAAPATPCFSDLPSAVAAHIFSLLSNEDRLPVLDVCTAWHAIIDAGGPGLWPTVVLEVIDEEEEEHPASGTAANSTPYRDVPGKCAALSPRLRSLVVDAADPTPETILNILAAVPAASLVRLSVKGQCPASLPVVLQRFRRLQRVELKGDASRVSWEGPGGVRLAGMIANMELRPVEMDYYLQASISERICLSPARAAWLGGALSQLTRLALGVRWNKSLPALCAALPSLRVLSLCARGIWEPAQKASVVHLLVSLPRLTAVDLAVTPEVCTTNGTYHSPDWDGCASLPAGLASVRGLSTLFLDTGIGLPPDWLQLSQLRALTLHNHHLRVVAPIEHPPTWLTQLQLYTVGEVAPALASLTSLKSLQLKSWYDDQTCHLPASLTALTALTSLELHGYKLSTVPAPVPDMTSLRSISLLPPPAELPEGRYLERLQELRWSGVGDLPPSLALATHLERLIVGLPHYRDGTAVVSLVAALPALRAVTLLSWSMTCPFHDFERKLRALRPDVVIALQY